MELSRRVGPRRRLAAAALAVTLVVAPGVAGDARDAYKDGTDAVAAGRFADAVRSLRAAIAERGEEKGGWRSYLPHYYLGVALTEVGDCPGALEAFAESERQGEIRREEEEHADLQQRQRRCRERLERLAALAAAVDTEIEGAVQAAEGVASLARLPQLAGDWEERFGDRHRAALARLEEARQGADVVRRNGDAAGLEAARQAIAAAAQELDAVAAAARERLGSIDKVAAGALTQLEDVEGSLRRMLRAIEDLAPYPPELAARVAEAKATLDEASSVGPEVQPSDLERLHDRLTVAMSRLRRAAQRPPQALATAVEAYLGGDFARALAALDGAAVGSEPRAKGQACLLRAASQHALWVLGGETEPDRLLAATAAILECGKLARRPDAPERYFSPRFRELYRATLDTGAAGD